MLRTTFTTLALIAFTTQGAFAAPSKVARVNPSVGTSSGTSAGTSVSDVTSVPAPDAPKKIMISLELLSLSNSLAMEAKADAAGAAPAATLSGSDWLGGIALGGSTRITDRLGISADLAYLMKKYTDSESRGVTTPADGKESVQLRTLRASGMALAYLAPEFSIGGGPYVSEVVGDTRLTDAAGNVTHHSFSDSSMKRFDYGAVIGARGEFALSPSLTFVADARFYYGIANLLKKESLSGIDASRYSISTRDAELAAGIGYRF